MLYLIRGLPGSGKSTFAKKIFPGIFHLENDMFHMVSMDDSITEVRYDFKQNEAFTRSDQCLDITRQLLNYGVPVIVSNVFPTKRSLERYTSIADGFGIPYKIFRMMNTQFQNEHDVPSEVFESMKNNFQDTVEEIFVESIPNSNFNYKLTPPSKLQIIVRPKEGV